MEVVDYKPRTVDEVFADYSGRRAAMIRALTKEVDNFREMCDPEKENLCLYGYPDERWEVAMPAEEVPPELPEPALGINFARDGMQMKDWLSLVAVHSDSWLLSVAFYFGARFGFEQNDRKRLFNKINELPTIFEVVSGANKKAANEKSSVTNHRENNLRTRASKPKGHEPESEDDNSNDIEDEEGGDVEDAEDEEDGNTLCGICEAKYSTDEFWICCDICENWFHGKCVNVTAAKAEHIKQYKCPNCSVKRARTG